METLAERSIITATENAFHLAYMVILKWPFLPPRGCLAVSGDMLGCLAGGSVPPASEVSQGVLVHGPRSGGLH